MDFLWTTAGSAFLATVMRSVIADSVWLFSGHKYFVFAFQFATIEAVITALTDEFPWLKKGYRKPIFVLILCASMLLLGLPCVTQVIITTF